MDNLKAMFYKVRDNVLYAVKVNMRDIEELINELLDLIDELEEKVKELEEKIKELESQKKEE